MRAGRPDILPAVCLQHLHHASVRLRLHAKTGSMMADFSDERLRPFIAMAHALANHAETASRTIDAPVGRDRLPAVTHWTVLAKRGGVSLVEFRIDTGRMHQIRIHAAALGAPVVGDRVYGDAKRDLRLRRRPERQLLHAVELSFLHPSTGKRVSFSCPPPEDVVYAV